MRIANSSVKKSSHVVPASKSIAKLITVVVLLFATLTVLYLAA